MRHVRSTNNPFKPTDLDIESGIPNNMKMAAMKWTTADTKLRFPYMPSQFTSTSSFQILKDEAIWFSCWYCCLVFLITWVTSFSSFFLAPFNMSSYNSLWCLSSFADLGGKFAGRFSKISAVVDVAMKGFFQLDAEFLSLESVLSLGTLTGWLPKSLQDLFWSFLNRLKSNLYTWKRLLLKGNNTRRGRFMYLKKGRR